MTLTNFLNLSHLDTCTYPSGFIVHGSVVLLSLVLFIWWTKRKALMSFRAWSLFMAIVHTFYFAITCSYVRKCFNLTMGDIYFIHGIEAIVTMVTILRFYFIIEAYGIDLTDKLNDINPIRVITNSIKMAVAVPESPKKINGNAKKYAKKSKNLREWLINALF